MDFAKAIRIIRAATGLSQVEFAERLNRNSSLISRIESGDRKPSDKLIANISQTFNTPKSLVYLLAQDDSTKNKDFDEIGKMLLTSLLKLG